LGSVLAAAPVVADVHLGFDPAAGLIEGTGTLAVGVTVDATASDLRGFSLVVEFDPTVVEILSVTAGPQLVGAACPNFLYPVYPAGADSVALDGATLGCSTAGPGTIATIVFQALPRPLDGGYPATTPLVWRSAILRDGDNATIPTICDPGFIDVVRPISVDPTSWARIKADCGRGRESP
jgi:hypothetical protein